MKSRKLVVQKFWGFGVTAVAKEEGTRGMPVSFDGVEYTAATSATTKDILYILDKVTVENLLDIQPIDYDPDAIKPGDYVVLRSINEGYYLLASDYFEGSVAPGDFVAVNDSGKFERAVTGVAKVIAVNEYGEVLIGPAY